VKAPRVPLHLPPGAPLQWLADMPFRLAATKPQDAASGGVNKIHAEHASFVWLTLQRVGVPPADIEDLLQEVFVVVHRRLSSFDGSAKMTSWLFGICIRVAASHRRRAYFRREHTVAELPDSSSGEQTPEDRAVVREAERRLSTVLDQMDLEARALFVMYEIDELTCETIAEMLGIPLGTVYSRLHAARKAFRTELTRFKARESMRAALRRRGGKP
jgi:RNA polymerase sigma-70 factor (ECF subfamily)